MVIYFEYSLKWVDTSAGKHERSVINWQLTWYTWKKDNYVITNKVPLKGVSPLHSHHSYYMIHKM